MGRGIRHEVKCGGLRTSVVFIEAVSSRDGEHIHFVLTDKHRHQQEIDFENRFEFKLCLETRHGVSLCYLALNLERVFHNN